MEITKNDTFDAWKEALASVLAYGDILDADTDRTTQEVRNMLITVTTADSVSTPIDYLSQKNEWIYPALREIEDVILGKHEYALYDYSYGARIFGKLSKQTTGQPAVDQINDYIIPLLKRSLQTRRASVAIALPNDGTADTNLVMPSALCIDFKVRNNTLHSTMFLRSSDMFIGWPANIYQLFMISQYVAERIHMPMGSLTTLSTSAHIFAEHEWHIKKLLHR